jgi:ACS family allantoate permease-like MFS transporter
MAQDDTSVGTSTTMDIEQTTTKDEHKLLKQAPDADEAMKAFEHLQGHRIEIDEATDRRLVKTIDWRMMPLMCFVYAMNYLDSMQPALR